MNRGTNFHAIKPLKNNLTDQTDIENEPSAILEWHTQLDGQQL